MRYIQEIEDQSSLRALILQDLKELGIKPPKSKKYKSRDDTLDNGNAVFGCSLCQIPCEMLDDCGAVPKFLVESTDKLSSHLDTEGLFRKSGSIARQKELKDKIDLGLALQDGHPYDICALMKLFLRELPEPLLPARFHDTFLKCQMIDHEETRIDAVMLLCLLLPWHHMSTLRFIMLFLKRVAAVADRNKMDAANLAVCLAPNILNRREKAEKMNMSESKLLQAQTSIVQLLIVCADEVGMVNSNLYERTTLMTNYLPLSEDELEKSDEAIDDNKGHRKKKKRSASLQGLVSNLSNSFTRWRRHSNENGRHNCSNVSDKSTMSALTMDQVDLSTVSGDSEDYIQQALSHNYPCDVTPKLMRKRKASNEMIAFSASKKKAILRHMPQMSALGSTPFTPHAKSRVRGHEFGAVGSTPSIKFSDGQQMVFNASVDGGHPTPQGLPQSSGTVRKCKRHSGQPHTTPIIGKTPKSVTKKKSMKGFFRRLSGGREVQNTDESLQSADDTGLSNCDADASHFHGQHGGAPIIMSSLTSAQVANAKKKGLFRRHKKTPSSPARLLNSAGSDASLTGSNASELSGYVDADGYSDDEGQSLAESCVECRALACGTVDECDNTSQGMTETELAASLQADLCADQTSPTTPTIDDSRRRSNGNTSLRRGKPNTVTSGLPVDRYLPSPDRSRRSCDGEPLISGPIRQSSKKEIFASPERRQQDLYCDATPFNTSPILKTDAPPVFSALLLDDSVHDTSSVYSVGGASSVEDNPMSRQVSTVSMVSMASDFDCAFLQESFTEDSPKGSRVDHEEDNFKKPSLPTKKSISSVDCDPDTVTKATIEDTQILSSTDEGKELCPIVKATSETDIVTVCDKDIVTVLKPAASLDSIVSQKKSGLNPTGGLQATPKSTGMRTPRRHTVQVPPLLQIPNLPISNDMQQLLSRAGVMDESTHVENSRETLSKSLNTQSCSRESVANLLDSHKGKVANSVKRFTSTNASIQESEDSDQSNVARRHASPLHLTQTRQRGTSPVRIPTIFASADSDTAERYRGLLQRPASTHSSTDTSNIGHKAKLPISTALLRSRSVECAKQKLSNSKEVVCDSDDSGTQQPLKDSSNTETPKIKASLMPNETGRRMPKTLPMPITPKSYKPATETPRGQRYRKSPIKPVKRLQGSPQSPKSPKHRKSPSTTIPAGRKHGLSPIPNHLSDWNV